jgi:hypothetical protein
MWLVDGVYQTSGKSQLRVGSSDVASISPLLVVAAW